MTAQVSTQVLDAVSGKPAAGISVLLEQLVDEEWVSVDEATTNADGRVAKLGIRLLAPGIYRIVFDTGAYFANQGESTFYPEVAITFELLAEASHTHVPLLLSPYAYSTYRDS